MTSATGLRKGRPFDLCGPLPSRHHRARGERRHGQDLHDCRAGRAVRRGGRGRSRPDAHRHVQPSGYGELRERVRERLTSAVARACRFCGRASRAPIRCWYCSLTRRTTRWALRRERLNRALTAFDAATIATTHQFCAQVLAGLGVTAELAALTGGDRFVESLDDLVTEVAEDLYLRKFAAPGAPDEPPGIKPEQARQIALDAVIREPRARLEPQAASGDSPAGMRRRLAEAVRDEVSRRKRLRGLRSYDDLQTDLAAVLNDPEQGPAAVRRLRERFPVVLIDEFQDTDPVQWEIVSKAFVDEVRLVLIGDPKQPCTGSAGLTSRPI